MRNPPIIRAVVSDHFGYVLYDSADPPRSRRLISARPPIVRLYAPAPARVADPAAPSKISGYILVGATLICALVGAAIAWGAVP